MLTLLQNPLSALLASIVIVAFLGAALLRLVHPSGMLKDQLIPQIAPAQQTYSLAKSQLGFWTIIYLASFLYMVAVKLLHAAHGAALGTEGLVNIQVLTLLGLSGATAIGGGMVDNQQDTPEDSVNDGLKALGLNDHDDVLALRKNIAALGGILAKPAPLNVADLTPLSAAQAKALNIPAAGALSPADDAALRPKLLGILRDRQLTLQSFEQETAGYLSQGWFRDMVTDINGTALHRLQAVLWTVLLGLIFVYDVYQTHAAPTLDPDLLALMGLSGTGYVGFKISEAQY